MKSKLIKQLKNAEYCLYDDTLYNSERLYQKRVSDEQGIKYFINFYQYNKEKTNKVTNITWKVKLQFQLSISTMSITLFTFKDNSDLSEIEQFIDDLWERLEAHYYEKN